MTDIQKVFIDPQDLMESSLHLAEKIFESGFKPNFIVAIWRGGTPVGIVIQELFEYFEIVTDHIAIRTSYYVGVDRVKSKVRVHGLGYLTKNMNAEDSLLIVDDVFDSGNSIRAVLDMIRRKSRKNTPSDIRIATPYYKPMRNQSSDLKPDYYVHETNDWLVFPHELKGLSREEISEHKPWLSGWLDEISKKS